MASAVDVEGLFRKFSVAEVKDIEKKVKADIERKKEDLRQMVGRRYRDIIETADSVNEMQTSSVKILSSIRRIEQSVDRLHNVQQQLIVAGQRAKIRPTADVAIAAESLAKFVADLLELVHEGLMYQQPLDAAWCFIMADYLYRNWKLNHGQQTELISRSFLEQRFANTGRLRQKIMDAALKVVSNCSNSTEAITDAVCAIAFLERANTGNALERFLQCRMVTLHHVFESSDCTSREQICSCLVLLQKTVVLLYQLFLPSDGSSQALEKMRSLVTSHWQPSLFQEYSKRQSRLAAAALPDGFDYGKVFFLNASADAEASLVCDLTRTWFNEALQYSSVQLSELVRYFDTIESLTVVKENVVSSLAECSETFEWTSACQKLFGEDTSLWRILCINPLEDRVKELIKRDVNVAFSGLVEISTLNDQKYGTTERMKDGDWWHELRTDTIIAGSYSTLQLKARGLMREIYRPVADLNTKIAQVDSALSAFLAGKASEANRSFTFNDLALHETLALVCVDAIERFISDINEKITVWRKAIESSNNGNEEIVQCLVLSAKFIQCFCDSADAVKKCIVRKFGLVGKVKDADPQSDKWSNLRSSLIKSAGQLYRTWVHCVLDNMTSKFQQRLSEAVNDVSFWIAHAQEWESIQIEEETEEGQKVSSTIFVPAACSSFVSELLHGVGRCIVGVGAQSIHNDVLSALSKSLRSAVVRNFNTVLSVDGIKLRQKQAVQLLFDFNVLTQLLNSSQNIDKDETMRVQRIVERFESFVDPFDLDVLKPHLKRNSTKVLQKWQTLYRVLYTPEALRASNVGNKTTLPSSAGETPQLVPLGVGQNRFYLLPIISESDKTTSGTSTMSKPQLHPASTIGFGGGSDEGDKTRQQSSRAQTSGSSFASTVFDKFSSSWFGGS